MNTVRYYRTRSIHDRSARFDKLRAGRIPVAMNKRAAREADFEPGL